ncbi:MAG: hypothetical protein IJ740_07800 [Ruminococcus sp.]|nr:hypothetical protein [Ruminococcus sp.]
MAVIKYHAVSKLGDKESVFESIERAQEILTELRQILYTLESKGVTLVLENVPTEGKSDGTAESHD